jgi:hypothetical protein
LADGITQNPIFDLGFLRIFRKSRGLENTIYGC